MTKLFKKLFGWEQPKRINKEAKIKAGVDRAVKEYSETFDKLVEYDRTHSKPDAR